MKIKISDIQNVPIKGHNELRVDYYLNLIKNNEIIEPILVKKVTKGYWLKDGAHRIEAHKRMNRTEINVIITPNSIDAS